MHTNLVHDIAFTGDRHSVSLPWKIGHKDLPSNYDICYSRLQGLLRKLKKDPETLVKYNEVIQDQLQTGIIEKVSQLERAEKVHYLPHHAVVREEAETTKVRVVFDASCRESRNSVSLNDCLHVGPSLTPLIFDILLRFRNYKVPLIGDIQKAFLNIEINPSDRDCLRFLWVSSLHSETQDIEIYRYNRVVFGVNSSPFLLNAVLRYHLEKFKDEDPEFVAKLIEGFFVDDLVTGAETVEEAFTLYIKARDRMKEGGFILRKWKSSEPALLQKIEEHESSAKKDLSSELQNPWIK